MSSSSFRIKKPVVENPFQNIPLSGSIYVSEYEGEYIISAPTANSFRLQSKISGSIPTADNTFRSWYVLYNNEVIEVDSYAGNTSTVILKSNFTTVPQNGNTVFLYNNVTASLILDKSSEYVSISYKRNAFALSDLSLRLFDINFKCRDFLASGSSIVNRSTINSSLDSTNIDNGGCLTVAGGASIKKKLYLGSINVGGTDLSQEVIDDLYLISRLNSTAGVAQANKALVVDSNRDITNVRNLQTENLTVNGTLVTSSATELNYNDISTIGSAEPAKALVVNMDKDISGIRNLSATNLTGTIQTASQPNITSVGTLTSLSTDNLVLGGTAVTSTTAELNRLSGLTSTTAELNRLSGLTSTTAELNRLSGLTSTTAELNRLSGLTSTTAELNWLDLTIGAGTGEASKALVLDANRDITNIRNMTLTGSLNAGSLLSNGVAVLTVNDNPFSSLLQGTAEASKPLVVDSNLNIEGINELSATSLASSTISLGGTLITATGSELNRLSGLTAATAELNFLDLTTGAGTGEASKALVLDANRDITNIRNLTATNLTGTIQTTSQPNITSVGTLTSLSTNSLVLSGISITATGSELNRLTGLTSTTAELNRLTGLTSTTAELNYLSGLTLGTIIASKAITVDADSNVNTVLRLTKTTNSQQILFTNGTSTGTVFHNNNGTLHFGTISSNDLSFQTNNIIRCSINSDGVFDIASGWSISGINITSTASELNRLSGLTSTTAELNFLDLTTGAGTGEASKALVLNANRDITNIRNLTATNLTGTIQTASQPNITSIGTLSSLTSSGSVTTGDRFVISKSASGDVFNSTVGSRSFRINHPSTSSEVLIATNTAQGINIATQNITRISVGSEGNVGINSMGISGNSLYVSGNSYLDGNTRVAGCLMVKDSTDTGRLISALDAAQAENTSSFVSFGRSNNGGNQVELSFLWVSSGSGSNTLRLGFHSNTSVVQIRNDNQVFRGNNSSSFNTTSDMRLKKDIASANLADCYENIKNLRLVNYKWIDNNLQMTVANDLNKEILGWIAQEVELVMPEAVITMSNDMLEDCKTLNLDIINQNMFGAVQKLIEDKELLENKLEDLTQKNIHLEQTIQNILIRLNNLEN